MQSGLPNTLRKEERICGTRAQERLFSSESRSMAVFPIRAVYLREPRQEGSPGVRIMVSVPKKCFKRAVKRNRVKRQVREAYRRNKHSLISALDAQKDASILVAFIWMDNRLRPSSEVEKRVQKLLCRLEEAVSMPSDTRLTGSLEEQAREQR